MGLYGTFFCRGLSQKMGVRHSKCRTSQAQDFEASAVVGVVVVVVVVVVILPGGGQGVITDVYYVQNCSKTITVVNCLTSAWPSLHVLAPLTLQQCPPQCPLQSRM